MTYEKFREKQDGIYRELKVLPSHIGPSQRFTKGFSSHYIALRHPAHIADRVWESAVYAKYGFVENSFVVK